MANEWVWYVEYRGDKRHLLLAERDSMGTFLISLGCFLLNRAAGRVFWRVRLDGPLYLLSNRILNAADNHEKILVSIPVEGTIRELIKGVATLEEYFEED